MSCGLVEYLTRTSGQSQVVEAQHAAPMWACSMEVLLTLSRFEVHEDMIALGKLLNLHKLPNEDRNCIFLSQTWASFDHPDPEGVKFRLVRELLQAMESCSIEFPMHWQEQLFSGYSCFTKEQGRDHAKNCQVWIDYWSVPQKNFEEQQAHIDSIWVYVQMSSLFIALVPPCQHRDTREMVDVQRWEERGWCRLESMANVLSERPAPFLVVESLGNRWLGSNHWMMKPVGQGKFTCCMLGHRLPDGREIQCDKYRIANMVEKLFDFKISGAEAVDDMFTFRLMQCLRGHVLGGLPVRKAGEKTLVEWMDRFRFLSPFCGASSGWTPLRYAVYEGRLDIAEQLIEMDVDIESPLTGDCCKTMYFHHKGMTILHGAAMVQDSADVVRFLIDKKADMNRTFGDEFTTAFAAAIGSAGENFKALVDAGCAMTGSLLQTVIQSNPKMLRICSQSCPELLGGCRLDGCPMVKSYSEPLQWGATMWACPSFAVRQLSKFEPHEYLVGDTLENLSVLPKEERRCIFVSQTWLGFDHPDPDGVKFRVLCDFLDLIESGSFSLPLHWKEQLFLDGGRRCISSERAMDAVQDGHLWMDYWSVPQRDPESQQEYIGSLGDFVQMSSLFVALVPPCQHRDTQEMVDFETWQGRGWCRLESTMHALSESPSDVLVVESRGNCWSAPPTGRLMRPVGHGRFTCCQLNHVLPDGTRIACDKERIAGMVGQLFERKAKVAKAADDMFTYRLVESLKEHLSAGLPLAAREREGLREWLRRFRFSSPTDGDNGWTPLRYAIYESRLDIAGDLLQAGADIESPLNGDFEKQVYFHRDNLTILQGVCLLRDSPELVKFMIDHGARVNRTFGGDDFTAFFASALVSATGNFEALLDSGGGPECEAASDSLTTAIHESPPILNLCCRRCLQLL